MGFQKGNQMFRQRKSNNGRRPTKSEAADRLLLRKKAIAMIEAKAREAGGRIPRLRDGGPCNLPSCH